MNFHRRDNQVHRRFPFSRLHRAPVYVSHQTQLMPADPARIRGTPE